jgi:competence protein ComEA
VSLLEDVDSLKTKLHLKEIPVSLRIGLAILGAAILFILFQGLWQLGASDLHLTEDQAQSSLQDNSSISISKDENTDTEDKDSGTKLISIHVVGAVKNPGLYELAYESRVADAIDAAGGLTEDANQESVNLARSLEDGEQVIVASKNENSSSLNTTGSASSAASGTASTAGSSQGLVNINTADVAALSSLSGIGEATANKIIADREKNGRFKTTKDITRVSGIGDKKYEAIKDFITV